jgi:AcrR family transcriptional regulator
MAPRTQTPRRKTRGSYDPEQTRQLLLDSALELFGDQGFHGTSVQEIVERAQVTKGAFYHHFESKQDVLSLIHDEFLDVQREAIERILEEVDSPVEQLREVIRESVLTVTRYRQHVAVFFQERRYLTGRPAADVKRKRDKLDKAMDDIVIAGVEQGLFDARITPRVAVFGVVGMSAWVHQWYREDGTMSAEQVADDLANLALDGLVVR